MACAASERSGAGERNRIADLPHLANVVLGLQPGVWLRPPKSGIGIARCYSVGLVGAAPAAPPPTNAVRAGLGGGVPTGAVAATRALHGFGTGVLGAHSGRELGVVQVPRSGWTRDRVPWECHGNLRILTGLAGPT